jgi:phage/plasmid-like protein (TIGR03299 family)
MSQETSKWLNTMTLIGHTDKRGNAWHYRSEDQGTESNHYAGAIPVMDVKRRLFNWEPLMVRPEYTIPAVVTDDGVIAERRIVDDSRQLAIHPITGKSLGAFKNAYVPHGYSEWGLDVMSNLVGDTLNVESAGLLRNGAIAWVQIGVSENVKNKWDYDFRSHITFFTSLDGTLPTTYKGMATAVVCDNTLHAGMGESTPEIRVKHTRNSGLLIPEARTVFGLIERQNDTLDNAIADLMNVKVTRPRFSKFLDLWSPIPEGENATKRGITVAENRRETLTQLYKSDNRAAPWNGTAFGVMQAVNTYNQHYTQVRDGNGGKDGGSRFNRAMLNSLNGTLERETADIRAMVMQAVS